MEDSNIGSTSSILENFLSKCWKISLNEAKSIYEQMEHLHNMELEEHRAFKEIPDKQVDVDVKLDSQLIETTQLPLKSKINCRFHDAIKYKMKTIQFSEFLSLHSFLDKTFLGTNYSIYKNLISKYTNKYKFALRFILLLLKTRYKIERQQELCYQPYQIVQMTDFDIYNLIDDIFFYLEAFPNNVQTFLEKFLCFFFEEKGVYNSLNCFSKESILKYMNIYAFASLDSTIKVSHGQFIYEMYNFNEGYFHTVEEAQSKKIDSMPREDPIEIFGLNFNDEILQNQSHSNRFMKRILKIEKNWNKDKYSQLLISLDEYLEGKNLDNDKSISYKTKDFFFIHLSYLQQLKQKEQELIIFLESLQEVFQIDFDINKLLKTVFQPFNEAEYAYSHIEKYILNLTLTNEDVIKIQTSIPKLTHQDSIASSSASNAFGDMTPISIRNNLNIAAPNQNIRRKSNFNMEANNLINYERMDIDAIKRQQQTVNSQSSIQQKLIQSPNSISPMKDFITPPVSLQKYLGRVSQIAAEISNKHKRQTINFKRKETMMSIDSSASKLSINVVPIAVQEQYVMQFKDIQTTCMINELLAMENIFTTIREDLRNLTISVKNGEQNQIKGEKYTILKNILNNKCPEKWWKLGFQIQDQNLTDFIKQILIYYDYMKQSLINENQQTQNQIQINKLLNPFGLITCMIHQYCMKNKVSIEDVKLKMKKILIQKDLPEDNNEYFLLSGLFLRRGKIGTDSFLIDEGPREFESQFPLVMLKVELKIKNKNQQYKQSNILSKQTKRSIAIEFSQLRSSVDLESDYYFQIQNPFQQFQYEKEKQYDQNFFKKENIQSMNSKDRVGGGDNTPKDSKTQKANQIRESLDIHNKLTQNQGSLNNAFAIRVAMRDENTVKKEIKEINLKENEVTYPKGNYVVRIPIINPFVQSIFTQFPIELYLYMNSKKPQEYWDHKRTQIYMQKMNF